MTARNRALRLAGLTAGVTGSYAGYLIQRIFLTGEDLERKRSKAHAKAGRRIRRELEELRGPLMKLGQALSLHTEMVPEEVLTELARLQMQAPGMHPSLARAQFMASVGRPPEDCFKSFEPEPFAAASLGQVHRATGRDGAALAVKIQYPGIREAIEHDFRWLRNAAFPARATGHLPKGAIEEMEAEIMAETDYVREAGHLEFFAKRLRPLGFVAVPGVRRELSTDRVLVMTFLRGQHLDAFLAARPPQALRDRVGARLFELFYYQILVLEALHADPHWGNYLFHADGSLGLVDFGCVKRFEPGVVARLRKSFLYEGSTSSPEFQRIIHEQFAAPGRTLPASTRRAIVGFSDRFYRKVYPVDPKSAARPVDFSDAAFVRAYIRESSNLFRAKGTAPHYIFLARAEIGLYETLHRLKARVHTTAILRRLLEASR